MRKHIVIPFGAVALALLAITAGHAQPKGDKVTISGEVVDTWVTSRAAITVQRTASAP